MAIDKEYNRLIHSMRWVRLRREVLSEHPLCQRCEREGYLTAASEVHHKKPVQIGRTLREKENLMFDRSNLTALCHNCHVQEHVEMLRSGKELTRKRNSQQVSSFIKAWFGEN